MSTSKKCSNSGMFLLINNPFHKCTTYRLGNFIKDQHNVVMLRPIGHLGLNLYCKPINTGGYLIWPNFYLVW